MLRLVIVDDAARAMLQFALTQGQRLRLGRGADNDLVVPWPQVSLRHVKIEVRSDCVWLEDLGSRHGLVLGEKRCDRLRLTKGTDVRLGPHRLFIEEVDASDATVALPLTGDRPPQEAAEGSATADVPPGRSTAEAALTWLRSVTGGGPDLRRQMLRAADILGASGLALVKIENGKTRVDNAVGRVEPELIEEMVLGRGVPSVDVACESFADARFAIARFLAEQPPQPWRLDFLALVGRTLTRASSRPQSPSESRALSRPSPARAKDEFPLPPGMIRGSSPRMEQIFEQVRRVAPSELSILLLGPTGVGKELFARLVHDWSPRRSGPFEPILTTAMPETLVEAELFGIEKGVATGVKARRGLAIVADGGTLFLDEIGDLSLGLQAKLLRMLQDKEVRPVGSHDSVRVDVRIVTATHRDLRAMMEVGTFREDLYYRLAEMCVMIPPLDARREDIPELALAFLEASRGSKHLPGLTAGALEFLAHRAWPGNVRELKAVVRRAAALAHDGQMLDSRFFVNLLDDTNLTRPVKDDPVLDDPVLGDPMPDDPVPAGQTLEEHLAPVERQALVHALECNRGNVSAAARLLGLSRQGLKNRLERHGLDRRRFELKT